MYGISLCIRCRGQSASVSSQDKRLYKALTDNRKPRQTLQSPERIYRAPERLYKDQEY